MRLSFSFTSFFLLFDGAFEHFGLGVDGEVELIGAHLGDQGLQHLFGIVDLAGVVVGIQPVVIAGRHKEEHLGFVVAFGVRLSSSSRVYCWRFPKKSVL